MCGGGGWGGVCVWRWGWGGMGYGACNQIIGGNGDATSVASQVR